MNELLPYVNLLPFPKSIILCSSLVDVLKGEFEYSFINIVIVILFMLSISVLSVVISFNSISLLLKVGTFK